MPYTSGQSTPAVCTALSSSYAAMGTTCTWGNVPTTDAPTSTPVDPTYTPPPYTPPVTSAQANAPDDCTTEEPDDTEAATETFWITSITTTPCSTTSSAADAPTSSVGLVTVVGRAAKQPSQQIGRATLHLLASLLTIIVVVSFDGDLATALQPPAPPQPRHPPLL